MSKAIALLSALLLWALPESTASLRAQEKHPDFTGVYYPINPFGNVVRGRAAAAPPAAGAPAGTVPPPRPVLVLDGREGRPENAPKLKPEYLAKWEVIRKSRMAGSDEFDPNARCVSAGMPNMMSMTYGMEIQQTRDRITIYGELNDVYRRIYLDGRKPSAKVLDDPTFAGYSTGHWEGETLVVDTVAIREDTLFDTFSPHSDQFTVRERIRFVSPGVIEDQITSTDPKALVEPFTAVRTYRKASPPNDELREFSCAEGLGTTK
ncbi:MAG TPA: hypothetical protein VFO31_14925 [Vicinamibacterales bacterium]|nr:hypothetical protein [Vicinamibacterales bacterium]